MKTETTYTTFQTKAILVDDSVESCVATGIPAVPALPLFTLPQIPTNLTAHLLLVGEFLYKFSVPLDLKRQLPVSELATALARGRGLSDVYNALLQVYSGIFWALFEPIFLSLYVEQYSLVHICRRIIILIDCTVLFNSLFSCVFHNCANCCVYIIILGCAGRRQ